MNEVLRQEKKYLLSAYEALRLKSLISSVMTRDIHDGGAGYPVRSLYFDSFDDRDFHDKVDGAELRRKIRLRCYDPRDDYASLEMKQKQGAYQKKRSLRMGRREAQKLIDGEYGVLLGYDEPFAAECYAVMSEGGYRPRAVVRYKRAAFVAKENRIRLTFDSEITATESGFDLFSEALPQYPVLDPLNTVLEVKFNGFLLTYIKKLLAGADSSEISVSKYCLARGIGFYYGL